MKQARIIVGANYGDEGSIAQQNARKKNIGNMKMRMNINQKN